MTEIFKTPDLTITQGPSRLVAYADAETGGKYRFVTNAYHMKAGEIAAIYKERWQTGSES